MPGFDIIRNFLAENALKFVAQEVLDENIDKLLAEVCKVLKDIGLDPLPIPDIKIPYNLDKVTEAVMPMLGEENSPARQLAGILRQLCAGCTNQVTGNLNLSEGLLGGLSKLARQGPVNLQWEEEGSVRLGAKFGVENLSAPFKSEANLHTYTINPDITARLANVALDLDVKVPVTGGKVESNFDMITGPVDVDLDNMGPLNDVVDYITPHISKIVGEKVKEILNTKVKEVLLAEVEKRIPGISALVH